MTRQRCAVLAALCAAVVFALPSAAAALTTPHKAIWGPVIYKGKSQFPIYRDLGVDIFEYALGWASIAPTRPQHPRDPTDPAYRWPSEGDLAVTEAARNGMQVSMMLITTPPWANGGRGPTIAPDRPSDFADFAEAAARHYRGVHRWMIWGEPLRVENFGPIEPEAIFRDDHRPLTAAQAAAPRRYATLLDAAYASLKGVRRSNIVIGGNTTTVGSISPFSWIRYMRLPNGLPPRMDLFGHNPFGTRRPRLASSLLHSKLADFSDLDSLAGWLDQFLGRHGRNPHLRIFISEYAAATDVPSFDFGFHVTRALQASWLRSAFGIARSWSRIETLGWLALRDQRRPDGSESRVGLIDAHGVRKPAYYVYKRASR